MKPAYHTFLGLSPEQSSWEESEYCILQVPLEHTVSFQTGCATGPQGILRASEELQSWDEDLNIDAASKGICTLALNEIQNLGLVESLEKIESRMNAIAENDKWPLVLGGEQSLSLASLKAMRRKHPKMRALFLDAFLNLKDKVSGSSWGHQSVTRRCIESGISCAHLGARSVSHEENSFLSSQPLEFPRLSLKDYRNDVSITSLLKGCDSVYLSIDLGVLDPAVCPAVSFPEPDGFTWSEILKILGDVFQNTKVVGADICGLSPLGVESRSEVLAARLAHKIISLQEFQSSRKR